MGQHNNCEHDSEKVMLYSLKGSKLMFGYVCKKCGCVTGVNYGYSDVDHNRFLLRSDHPEMPCFTVKSFDSRRVLKDSEIKQLVS